VGHKGNAGAGQKIFGSLFSAPDENISDPLKMEFALDEKNPLTQNKKQTYIVDLTITPLRFLIQHIKLNLCIHIKKC
jgi:hypothetical protein